MSNRLSCVGVECFDVSMTLDYLTAKCDSKVIVLAPRKSVPHLTCKYCVVFINKTCPRWVEYV